MKVPPPTEAERRLLFSTDGGITVKQVIPTTPSSSLTTNSSLFDLSRRYATAARLVAVRSPSWKAEFQYVRDQRAVILPHLLQSLDLQEGRAQVGGTGGALAWQHYLCLRFLLAVSTTLAVPLLAPSLHGPCPALSGLKSSALLHCTGCAGGADQGVWEL